MVFGLSECDLKPRIPVTLSHHNPIGHFYPLSFWPPTQVQQSLLKLS